MGLGDDVIFLGKAEEIYKETGKKITPLYGSGWSPLYKNVEFLVKDGGLTVNARDTSRNSDRHVNYYVKEREQTILGERMVWNDFKPTPFKIRLSKEEKSWAKNAMRELKIPERFFLVNPDYKSTFFSENKNWGFKKWQELTDRLSEHIPIVRIHPGNNYREPDLKNALNTQITDIRRSISVMANAQGGVSYDGLLMHIFAGFEIPMTVIQGGLITPRQMSYDIHNHIGYDHPQTPCGATYSCPHCLEANEYISVDMVYEKCLEMLK